MSRNKYTDFSFSIPIPKIDKKEGLFQVTQTGEILIFARARIAATLQDIPAAFAESDEIKIILQSAHYNGVDILPVLNLPDARPLLASINRAAYNSLHTILNEQ